MRALPALLALAALPAWSVPMYKCVDARGVTHYTETPHPACKGRAVDIKPLPPPSGTESAPAKDLGEQEREFQRRKIDRGRTEEKAAAESKARERRCQSLRAEIARLTNSRVYTRNDKGERVIMDDAALAKRIAELQAEANKTCA